MKIKLQMPNSHITCAYLYADGRLVIVRRSMTRLGGIRRQVEHIELYERPFKAVMQFTGRIVFSRSSVALYLALAEMCDRIECVEPEAGRGSELVKSMGLMYGSLNFWLGDSSLDIQTLATSATRFGDGQYGSICDNGYLYQPHHVDSQSWADGKLLGSWDCVPVTKYVPAEKQEDKAQAAA